MRRWVSQATDVSRGSQLVTQNGKITKDTLYKGFSWHHPWNIDHGTFFFTFLLCFFLFSFFISFFFSSYVTFFSFLYIFHQPRFPWNKGISLTKPPFGVRSCEVAIIWPDIYINMGKPISANAEIIAFLSRSMAGHGKKTPDKIDWPLDGARRSNPCRCSK